MTKPTQELELVLAATQARHDAEASFIEAHRRLVRTTQEEVAAQIVHAAARGTTRDQYLAAQVRNIRNAVSLAGGGSLHSPSVAARIKQEAMIEELCCTETVIVFAEAVQ